MAIPSAYKPCPEGLARAKAAAHRDLCASRQEGLFPWPQALKAWCINNVLHDPRDLHLLQLLVHVALFPLPTALILYALPPSHVLGCVWFVLCYACFLQRFILALHYSEHGHIFATAWQPLNHLAQYILAPLYGIPPGIYRLHHCIMHHVEDNAYPKDLSSTEPYQRDSWLCFFVYTARFVGSIWVGLPWYAFRAHRVTLALSCIASEVVYLLSTHQLWALHATATLWVLVLPFVVSCLALSFGNWSQHIFIDQDSPSNDYLLTYNCIGAADNQRTFNDGYHIIHHVNSKVHWSELPRKFIATLDNHVQCNALVFEGMHFFDIGWAVMRGDYARMCKALVPLTTHTAAMSDHEKQQWLRDKLKAVTQRGKWSKDR